MGINYVRVGSRISQRRKELKIKQAELADRIGIDYKYLSSLETGRRRTTLEMLASLCQELNTTYDYFLLGNIRKNMEENIMDSLMLCSEADKEMIVEIINFCAERNKNNLTK
ncbi:MAG: helix-turn-helix transcriptional regulator [Ruminococcaceae bacterium]|nr:helix-turn-helix transcriptional regulator [Oscillospiraceae bacterium]